MSSQIPGVIDQIIFSPAQAQATEPLGIKSVTSNFLQFIDDLYQFAFNENYFVENSDTVEDGYWDYEYECDIFFWGDFPEWHCDWYPVWVDVEYTVYPGIHHRAVDIWEEWQAFETGSGQYSEIVSFFEQELGTVISNDVVCTADKQNEFPESEIPDGDKCKAISIASAIAAIRRQTEELHQVEHYFGRIPGRLYVTAHALFPKLRRLGLVNESHMALEYRDPASLDAEWLSAGWEFSVNSPTALYLVAEPNRSTDQPSEDFVVAEVVHCSGLGPQAHFALAETAQVNYDNGLPYWPYPESTVLADYNSNGYVAGLVAATQGIANFNVSTFAGFNDFAGGSRPVPNSEFSMASGGCK